MNNLTTNGEESKPPVSVVMAVYNGEEYLSSAIESILQQTYQDFEFIIINDASTDKTSDILQKYLSLDQRISIINNATNSGLGVSLQKGIAAARGEFIARMDADDISLPDRFEKQIKYLQNHPEIMVLGGDHAIINELCEITGNIVYPKLPNLMRWNMLLGSGLIVSNGAAVIRSELFSMIGRYSDFRAAQDFELWSRMFFYNPLPIANLESIIYLYRQHSKTTTRSQHDLQEQHAIETRLIKIEEFLGRSVSQNVVLAYRHPGDNYADIRECIFTWIEIYQKFLKRFNVSKEVNANIKTELFYEINKYSTMRPKRSRTRIKASIFNILPKVPLTFSAGILWYKIRYLLGS